MISRTQGTGMPHAGGGTTASLLATACTGLSRVASIGCCSPQAPPYRFLLQVAHLGMHF